MFGVRVRRLRESRGLTQERLAELTGISRNQIQNLEGNRNNTRDSKTGLPGPGNPRLETIFLLAQHLEVEVGYLVSPDPELLPPDPRGLVRH